MLRSARFGFGIFVLFTLLAVDARAQYGGYGWGGWGGSGASTVGGSLARGLGSLEVGAGVYNKDTAIASSVNEATVKDWNIFMFQSQQEANRREYLRMARRMHRDAASGDAVYKQLRENPSERDIRDGNALNVVLDQVTDPTVSGSSLRLANDPISSDVVRSIPFTHASEAATISLNQLAGKDAWPFALRGREFDEPRRLYQDTIARALKEDEEGDINPASIRAVRAAIAVIHDKFAAAPPKDPAPRVEAENYIKALYGMTKMLESPHIEAVIAELEKVPNTTLGNLLGFMHAYNLRFAPASTPKQEAVYRQIYPLLIAQRDRVLKPASQDADTAARPARPRPTEFFQGMHMGPLSGRTNATPPPPSPDDNPK